MKHSKDNDETQRPRCSSVSTLLIILFLTIFCPCTFAEPVQVKVDSGILNGISNETVQSFRGAPYAAAPVGKLRWRPPQPVQSWTGVRDATTFGAACPQRSVPQMIDGAPGQINEDCLSLNIWAPFRKQGVAPVMVWLHGGGNENGAGSKQYYDGTAFARDGIVLVTINYRLGVLGFFAHRSLTAEASSNEPLANFGLMDQIAALKWVQKNISAFGGDPKNVTVFGESAGGQDILALLTAPSAKDLFAKAIVESGGGWMHLRSLQQAESTGDKIAGELGLGGTVTAEQLRGVPVQSLLKIGMAEDGLIIDGRLLLHNPTLVFAHRQAAHVPMIIGSNSNDGSLLDTFEVKPSEVLSEFSADELTQARALYGTGADDAALAHDLFRDLNFAGPARWIARHDAASAPTFLYRFSYIREHQIGRVAGAGHGSEIPYVFDSWQQAPMQGAFLTARDRAEVTTVHSAWVAFAKTGAPAYPGSPIWPAYQASKDELFDFGVEAAVLRSSDASKLDFVERHAARQSAGELPFE